MGGPGAVAGFDGKLSQPVGTGPGGGGGGEPYAQVAETHSAVVFFAGDRVYKLKNLVNLGFLDFSTPQARAVACAGECELNRRYAPDVYLGVARGPDGEACEHLVVMRRMPPPGSCPPWSGRVRQ